MEARLVYSVRDDKNLLAHGDGPHDEINKLTSNLCKNLGGSIVNISKFVFNMSTVHNTVRLQNGKVLNDCFKSSRFMLMLIDGKRNLARETKDCCKTNNT